MTKSTGYSFSSNGETVEFSYEMFHRWVDGHIGTMIVWTTGRPSHISALGFSQLRQAGIERKEFLRLPEEDRLGKIAFCPGEINVDMTRYPDRWVYTVTIDGFVCLHATSVIDKSFDQVRQVYLMLDRLPGCCDCEPDDKS